MALTLTQLRTIITQAEALQDVIDTLASLGFNSTSWQSGSEQRTMIEAYAVAISRYSELTDSLSRLAFNSTSTGNALTAFADSHYQNTRIPASSTIGTAILTGGAVGPPHIVAAGDLTAADANGLTFSNTTGGTVPVSGTLSLTWQATTPGIAGNIANDTLTILQTPLAGVTINNPDPSSGSWITTLGTDQETDAALILRNIAKWGTLSPSDPAARYEFFIRTAVPTSPRVEIVDDNPVGPGTLQVYIAGLTGVSPAGDVAVAQTELERITNPTAEVGVNNPNAGVFAADAQPQAFVFTAYILTANNTAATQALIEQALRDYVNGIDISGTLFPDSLIGRFVLGEAITAMSSITGVERIDFTTPAADVNITAHDVMTVASITPTYVSV